MFSMIRMRIMCVSMLLMAVVHIISMVLMVTKWSLKTASLYVYMNAHFRSTGAMRLQGKNASLQRCDIRSSSPASDGGTDQERRCEEH